MPEMRRDQRGSEEREAWEGERERREGVMKGVAWDEEFLAKVPYLSSSCSESFVNFQRWF